MSKPWIKLDLSDPNTLPQHWEHVLGYDPDRFTPVAICYWYFDSEQQISWSRNGTSGYGILPPRYWQPIELPEEL